MGRLPVALLLLLATSAALAADGMYVWEEAVGMTNGRLDEGVSDAEAQDRLLRLCQSGPLDIRRLYFLADPASWSEPSLRSFLADARARGIDVYAVPVGAIQDAWIRPFRFHRRCDHEAHDMPIELREALHPVPAKSNPLGVKGTGEAGTTASIAAVMNAISNAIPNGAADHMEMPATPSCTRPT